MDAEPELLDFALQGIPDPEPHAANVDGGSGDTEVEFLERRASAEEQKGVHELPDLLKGRRQLPVGADDAEASGELPEVEPAPREHAGLHGLLRREEVEDAVQDLVGEGADAVAAARRNRGRRSLGRLKRTHSAARGRRMPPSSAGQEAKGASWEVRFGKRQIGVSRVAAVVRRLTGKFYGSRKLVFLFCIFHVVAKEKACFFF
jgi:hypothetical protein